MGDKNQRMQDLVSNLNAARKAHGLGQATMPDDTYNNMMLELVGLEFELGIKLDDSPTQADGFIESMDMLHELSNGKGEAE